MRGAPYIYGMTDFDILHPRDGRSKQFVDKANSAPDPDVLGPADATVKQLLTSPGGARGELTRGADDFDLDDLVSMFKDYGTGKALRLYRDPDDPEAYVVSNGGGRIVPFRAGANAHVFDLTKQARELWAEADEAEDESGGLWSFPGYDDQPRDAQDALNEWADTLDLPTETTDALWEGTDYVKSAGWNMDVIAGNAERQGVDLDGLGYPMPQRAAASDG